MSVWASCVISCTSTRIWFFVSWISFASTSDPAGGPRGGSRFLLDSNLDWGQDLARLGRFLEREGQPRIALAYFGTADPSAYGIEFGKLLLVHDFDPRVPPSAPSPGDLVAVSVNLLHGLYYDEDRAVAEEVLRRGWVSRRQLGDWLDLREARSRAGRDHPGLADWLTEQGLIGEEQRRRVETPLLSTWFERLRSEEQPEARVGDSILVYRVPAPGSPVSR